MLSKKTRHVKQDAPRSPGPCGGTTIWYLAPARHWCKMTDAEIALYILGGGELHNHWGTVVNHDAAWLEGTIALKRSNGNYDSVVLNSNCRWKKGAKREHT